jgi:(p)ppGpp synthase/HD superfamily hydrolase
VAEEHTDEPLLTRRFDEALHLATAHHARQLRKGTPIPYVAHLLGVASLVLEMHGDEDEAIAGLLHDVVEDGGGAAALEDIRARFGPAVADVVAACSDWTGEGERPGWFERKRDYVEGFADKAPAALRVSLADKVHNSRAILLDYRTEGDALWARFGQTLGGATRAYYRELAIAFEAQRDRLGAPAQPYVDELRRTVDEISALAEALQGPDQRQRLLEG